MKSRGIEMRIPMHHTPEWRRATHHALYLLIAITLIGIFAHSWIEAVSIAILVEAIEVLLTGFLVLDILLWFIEARNKYCFIKRNWIKIAAVLPFAFAFRGLRLLQIEALAPFLVQAEWASGISILERMAVFEKFGRLVMKIVEIRGLLGH